MPLIAREKTLYSVFTLIRFSFLSADDNGYRLAKGRSFEQRKAALFEPRRLNRRFDVFEHLCLPSLRAQSTGEFYAIILASDLMPEPYKERLTRLVAPYDNITAVFEGPACMPYEDLWLEHIDAVQDRAEWIATARLDDDDVLAPNYTKDLARYLCAPNEGLCVSFPRGLQCRRVNGELRFWESYWPLVAAGLAFVSRGGSPSTVYSLGHHHEIMRRHRTLVDPGAAQYIVTLHGENDSQIDKRARRRLLPSLRRKPPPDASFRQVPEQTLTPNEARLLYPGLGEVLASNGWSIL